MKTAKQINDAATGIAEVASQHHITAFDVGFKEGREDAFKEVWQWLEGACPHTGKLYTKPRQRGGCAFCVLDDLRPTLKQGHIPEEKP